MDDWQTGIVRVSSMKMDQYAPKHSMFEVIKRSYAPEQLKRKRDTIVLRKARHTRNSIGSIGRHLSTFMTGQTSSKKRSIQTINSI